MILEHDGQSGLQGKASARKSLFNAYFQDALYIVQKEADFAPRIQHLYNRLSEQPESILDRIREWPVLESIFDNDKDKDEFLFTCYQRVLSALHDVTADTTSLNARGEPAKWIAIYQLLSTHLSHEQIIELVERFIQVAALVLTDSQLLLCSTYLEEVSRGAEATAQRHYLSANSAAISKEVIDAIRSGRSTDLSEFAQEIDLRKLEEDFSKLLQTWANTRGPRIACELEFLHLFLARLITHHPASHRFWIIVLFKLDTILASYATHSTKHALSDSIEILINGAHRFEFLCDCVENILPCYEEIKAPIGELLIIFLLLQTQSHACLYWRFLRAINCQSLLDNTQTRPDNTYLLPDALQQIHRRALDILRPAWERAYLDWLSETCEKVDRLLAFTRLTRQLLKVSENRRGDLGSIIARNQTGGESAPLASSLLATLLQSACFSTAVTEHSQMAKDLYRFKVTLILDPDTQAHMLTLNRDIALGLQRLEVPMPELQTLIEAIQPLLASLENVIDDNLNFSNGLLSSAKWNELGPAMGCAEDYRSVRYIASLVAMYRRLYNPVVALLELKARYTEMLLRQRNVIDVDNVLMQLSTFQDYLSDPEQETNPELLKTLEAFLQDFTMATAAKNLKSGANVIATDATREVMNQHPKYAKQIGEEGIGLCARDNTLLLLRTAHVMGGAYLNGQDAMMSWWDATIGAYMITGDKEVLKTNLKSLQASLASHLHAREAKHVFDLVHGVYLEATGTNLKRHAVQGAQSLSFSNLPSVDARWRRVFGESRSTMGYVSSFQGILNKNGSLVGLNSAIIQQIHAFAQAFADCGDEESAWQQIQPSFNAALEHMGAEKQEAQWRSLLCYLPDALPDMQSAYWTEVLRRGLEILRQVGLGRKLEQNASELGRRIAAQLTLATDASADHEQKCQRDLTMFLQHLADVLRTQPPSLAVLNVGRYLVQCIAPFVEYPGHIWHLVWLQLQETLMPLLDRSEKLSLFRWVARLEVLSSQLHLTRPLGEMIFHNPEFFFSETQASEYAWRDAMGGLLVAALSGDHSPIPGEALVQRLVLSSVVFQAETPGSWETRQATLADAFHGVLGEDLERLVRIRHEQIITTLTNLSCIEEHNELSTFEASLVVLKGLPYARGNWQNYICMRVAEEQEPSGKPTESELLVSHLTNWSYPSKSDFTNAQRLYRSACELQDLIEVKQRRSRLFGRVTSFTLLQSQLEELKLLLRRFVLQATFQGEQMTTMDVRAELFEMLWIAFARYDSEQQYILLREFFRSAYDSEQQHVTLRAFFGSLQQESNMESLAGYAQLLMMYVVHATLARRAIDDADVLGRACIENSRPYRTVKDSVDRSVRTEECIRDISFLMRHIGLQLSGLQPHSDLAQWYWQHIGVFLLPPTRNIAMSLLPTLPNTSRHLLTSNESERLAIDVADLCKVFDRPDWKTSEAR